MSRPLLFGHLQCGILLDIVDKDLTSPEVNYKPTDDASPGEERALYGSLGRSTANGRLRKRERENGSRSGRAIPRAKTEQVICVQASLLGGARLLGFQAAARACCSARNGSFEKHPRFLVEVDTMEENTNHAMGTQEPGNLVTRPARPVVRRA